MENEQTEYIPEFSKTVLRDAKKEVVDERAFVEKQKAKNVLRGLLKRKDFAEAMLEVTNEELKEVDELLKQFKSK